MKRNVQIILPFVLVLVTSLTVKLFYSECNWEAIVIDEAFQIFTAILILMICRAVLVQDKSAIGAFVLMIMIFLILKEWIGSSWVYIGLIHVGFYRPVYILLLLIIYEIHIKCKADKYIICAFGELSSIVIACMGAGILWIFDAPLSLCFILFFQAIIIAFRSVSIERKERFLSILLSISAICGIFATIYIWQSKLVWERFAVWAADIEYSRRILASVRLFGESSHQSSELILINSSRAMEGYTIFYGVGITILCIFSLITLIVPMMLSAKKQKKKESRILYEIVIIYFITQTLGSICVFFGILPDLDFMLPFFTGGGLIPVVLVGLVLWRRAIFPNKLSIIRRQILNNN